MTLKRGVMFVLSAAVFLTGVVSSGLPKQKVARDTQEITVGKLGIGMGKDRVVSLLAQDGFQIVPHGNNSTAGKAENFEILMFSKGPHEAMETIFKDGKLIRASKSVDFQTSDEALESLYGLIAKFQESGHTACHLDTRIKADGEGTIKIATINCMSKFIEITVMRNNAGEVRLMDISEGIQK